MLAKYYLREAITDSRHLLRTQVRVLLFFFVASFASLHDLLLLFHLTGFFRFLSNFLHMLAFRNGKERREARSEIGIIWEFNSLPI